MDILSDKLVKIRKPRECDGCYTDFQPGAELNRQVAADGGDIWSFYTCPDCNTLMKMESEWWNSEGFPRGFALELMKYDGFRGTVQEYTALRKQKQMAEDVFVELMQKKAIEILTGITNP